MAAVMAAAAVAAFVGLRAGVQKEEAAGGDAESAPDVASAETRVPGAESSGPTPQPES
jgi:hypothetical protein